MQNTLTHALKTYFSRNMLLLLLLGFSSGLPFLLILSTLSFWLSELGFKEGYVTFFTIVSLPYSLKFLWAPLMEQIEIPFFSKNVGHKKSYGLIAQFCLGVMIYVLGCCHPEVSPWITGSVALMVCFLSATQDIVIDALRIEILNTSESGAGAAMESIGFHFGKFASGVGVMYLANAFDWHLAYQLMAFGMIPGMIALFMMPKDALILNTSIVNIQKRDGFFHNFLTRYQLPWRNLKSHTNIFYLLIFVALFKLPDAMLNATQPSFLYSLGLDKIEFANITKFYGTGLMILGAIAAGIFVDMIGLLAAGVLAGTLMAVSCVLFSIQAIIGYHATILMMTIGVESFASGMANSVFIAILSSFCVRPYTGSHFTILYSFGSFCRVIISTVSGSLAQVVGWKHLFLCCAFVAIPMVVFLRKSYHAKAKKQLKKIDIKKRA